MVKINFDSRDFDQARNFKSIGDFVAMNGVGLAESTKNSLRPFSYRISTCANLDRRVFKIKPSQRIYMKMFHLDMHLQSKCVSNQSFSSEFGSLLVFEKVMYRQFCLICKG